MNHLPYHWTVLLMMRFWSLAIHRLHQNLASKMLISSRFALDAGDSASDLSPAARWEDIDPFPRAGGLVVVEHIADWDILDWASAVADAEVVGNSDRGASDSFYNSVDIVVVLPSVGILVSYEGDSSGCTAEVFGDTFVVDHVLDRHAVHTVVAVVGTRPVCSFAVVVRERPLKVVLVLKPESLEWEGFEPEEHVQVEYL